MEHSTDRQAAEAVRSHMDWKDVLSLELTDLGFASSVLTACRGRLHAEEREEPLLGTRLDLCRGRGLVKARGTPRTASTHVLAAIRTWNRLECVGETRRVCMEPSGSRRARVDHRPCPH
jgi:transposase